MNREILAALRPAIVMLLLFTLLTGLVYPFAVLGVAQLLFPHQSNGSIVTQNGRAIGSELIGQNFTAARYFHGRPSAAGKGYDALNSGGSNLGPTSKALHDRISADVSALRKNGFTGNIPADLVTTSASGLDPDISQAAAQLQVSRVAAARHLSEAQVSALVVSDDQPLNALLGAPRVNVLTLNRQLDALTAKTAR